MGEWVSKWHNHTTLCCWRITRRASNDLLLAVYARANSDRISRKEAVSNLTNSMDSNVGIQVDNRFEEAERKGEKGSLPLTFAQWLLRPVGPEGGEGLGGLAEH